MARKLNATLRNRYKEVRKDIEDRAKFEEKQEQERIELSKPRLHAVSLFKPLSNRNPMFTHSLCTMLKESNYHVPIINNIMEDMADKEIKEAYLESVEECLCMFDYLRRRYTNDFIIQGNVTMSTMMNTLKCIDLMNYIEKCIIFNIDADRYTHIKDVYKKDIYNRGYRFLDSSTLEMEYDSGTPEELYELTKYMFQNLKHMVDIYTEVQSKTITVLGGNK